MNDRQHQNEAACGGSALTAELGADLTIPNFLRHQGNLLAEKDAEIERLRDLADEYNRLMRHMDAGGDFFAFQVAEAGRRNAPVPNAGNEGPELATVPLD